MSKFKVGDRVVTTDTFSPRLYSCGAEGSVFLLDTDGTVAIKFTSGEFDVRIQRSLGFIWVCEVNLELAKPRYSTNFTQQTSGVGFGDFLVEGHTSDGGGLQKHSVGDTYPWLVVGYGRHEEVTYCLQNLQDGTTLVSKKDEGDDFHYVRQWGSVVSANRYLKRYLAREIFNDMPIECHGKPVFTITGLIIKA